MTEIFVVAAAVLMVGAVVAKTATGGLLARLRVELADMAAEERQSASAEKKLEAHLGVMRTREHELKRDVKKLDILLAQLEAQLAGEERDADDGAEVGAGDRLGSDEPESRAGEQTEAGQRSPPSHPGAHAPMGCASP